MPKRKTVLTTRLGSCSSGRPVDMPYDFLSEVQIRNFVQSYSLDEVCDLLCMLEALLSEQRTSDEQKHYRTFKMINDYLRKGPFWSEINKRLLGRGLCISPDYVRYGQGLLLG